MRQLRKADTPPTKWVIQVPTLSSQQQTAKICATLKFEAKHEGDRTTISPEDFEKLNIIISDFCLTESLLRLDEQGYACQFGLNFIKFIQSGGAA